MTAKSKSRTRRVLHGATVIALLAGSAYFTIELRKEEQAKAPAIQAVTDKPVDSGAIADDGSQKWERLKNPARSVLRDGDGDVLATFTDGARTATLTGPSRTFTEPANTKSKVVTENWVRLMPEEWRKGSEREQWFKDWFKENYGSKKEDLFAIAFQYGDQAPPKKDADGTQYAGDAAFGPLNPNSTGAGDLRLEESDFYDYLGQSYTFRSGTTLAAEPAKYRAMDCSGFLRTVFGYRARYPLMATDTSGDGLPRTANGMARSKAGVDVIPLKGVAPADRPSSTDVLQPGDLVFFKLDTRTGQRLDHAGMYLGNDADGHKIFISSREEANGPTIGDKGGTSRLDGNGYYASTLRSAKRL
ncbi:C40 family peptidase [Streptomyces lunaelactis]|uniref:NlpC/P60 family protein n=1 Tax=Streptomyces lunaelactis TaxID=1535768 RepID=UPI0015858707|nr:NlpC/P60 family protein [Streptomyces lunaelactis]NUK38903.1 C40 family peptidase [Streptomyces lunaelactis]NUK43942.1 C40 family peptidase [Streptomyces lunaelactis]NUK96668.1 C40 family peptidase [Streptomyces lunaelactis]NUL33334.1 C40 family peptidase [Streptomyces lunaelactis]